MSYGQASRLAVEISSTFPDDDVRQYKLDGNGYAVAVLFRHGLELNIYSKREWMKLLKKTARLHLSHKPFMESLTND